jgi:hypothetical protein
MTVLRWTAFIVASFLRIIVVWFEEGVINYAVLELIKSVSKILLELLQLLYNFS